ncbi:MAG: KEOPS complex subunit Pcc1 [Candidatus Diapherotrites archaeon]|nr:KEOPS complex subunit Pcc1 [Candidatus Diapherotrites archaeon]MDZ4256131.1 KEOPS complex subunit Pcc1 [archaeon]
MPARTLKKMFSSPREAAAAQAALSLETGKSHERNARTHITSEKNRLLIHIEAVHSPALTASTATYTGLADFLKGLSTL